MKMNSPLWSKEHIEELCAAIEAAEKQERDCQTARFWQVVAVGVMLLCITGTVALVWW